MLLIFCFLLFWGSSVLSAGGGIPHFEKWLVIDKKKPQCMLKLKVEVAKLLNCFEEYYLFACGLGSKTKF